MTSTAVWATLLTYFYPKLKLRTFSLGRINQVEIDRGFGQILARGRHLNYFEVPRF